MNQDVSVEEEDLAVCGKLFHRYEQKLVSGSEGSRGAVQDEQSER